MCICECACWWNIFKIFFKSENTWLEDNNVDEWENYRNIPHNKTGIPLLLIEWDLWLVQLETFNGERELPAHSSELIYAQVLFISSAEVLIKTYISHKTLDEKCRFVLMLRDTLWCPYFPVLIHILSPCLPPQVSSLSSPQPVEETAEPEVGNLYIGSVA